MGSMFPERTRGGVAPMTDGIRCRAYQEGDELQITALLETAFGQSYSLPRWQWAYKQNPIGRIDAILAFSGSTLVGHSAAVPLSFQFGEHLVEAVRIQDAAVHPDFQGRGIFATIVNELTAHSQSCGVAVAVTFPRPHRPASRATFVKTTFMPIADVCTFSLPVARLSTPRGAAGARITISDAPVFTADDCSFVLSNLARCAIHGRRGREYLNWRYHRSSERNYFIVRAFRDGAMVGLSVCKLFREAKAIDLLELFLLGDADLLRAMLRGICNHFDGMGVTAFNVWSMQHYPLHNQLLSLGFDKTNDLTHVMAKMLSPTGPELHMQDVTRYFLSMGDSDVY
jgi:predicted N-acetyltransferase YhbS